MGVPFAFINSKIMRSMGVMVITTIATGCTWSFLAAADAQEVISVGWAELLEADMGLQSQLAGSERPYV